MKKFEVLTDIYFGDNALSRLSSLGCRKAFVVTDPFVVESGLIRHIKKPLEQGGMAYELFTDVTPDPPIEKVAAGVQAFLASDCDLIIGIGGGSALDLSKSIRKMSQQVDGAVRPRLVAIPTTSGTGSEVTSFAVISDPATQKKIPLVSDDMTPDEAILDEILVKSVPASVTADTGMDVLTHAIEAYVSTKNNEFSGALAEKAVEICGQYLYRSYYDNNDSHARRKMHIAATLAGLAFNSASLGLNHSMAHALGAHYHIPHGRANAMLLPLVIEYNSGVTSVSRDHELTAPCIQRYCNMATVLGLHSKNNVMMIHSLCNYIRFMCDDMKITRRLSEVLDITKEQYYDSLDAMAESALDDSCTETNPRIPTKTEIIELYKKLW